MPREASLFDESGGSPARAYLLLKRQGSGNIPPAWIDRARASRSVVDTGLHAKHWTRQQAIDYGIEASEVERYVVLPGQAPSYMIGELKILELRDKANKALGDKFSLKEFHNVILDNGIVPLEILERQTDAFIARADLVSPNGARPGTSTSMRS